MVHPWIGFLSTIFRSKKNYESLLFFGGGKTGNPDKNLPSREENQQQTQHTYDAGVWDLDPRHIVGGERLHTGRSKLCPRQKIIS